MEHAADDVVRWVDLKELFCRFGKRDRPVLEYRKDLLQRSLTDVEAFGEDAFSPLAQLEEQFSSGINETGYEVS